MWPSAISSTFWSLFVANRMQHILCIVRYQRYKLRIGKSLSPHKLANSPPRSQSQGRPTSPAEVLHTWSPPGFPKVASPPSAILSTCCPLFAANRMQNILCIVRYRRDKLQIGKFLSLHKLADSPPRYLSQGRPTSPAEVLHTWNLGRFQLVASLPWSWMSRMW